jgi:CheY-like chemotaxis protein
MMASAMVCDMLPMVLVVDDLPTNLDVAIGLLGSEALDVRAALSGEEALELARELEPDLILLDVMMPGLSGFDVCRRLKCDPQLAHIPVIFLSALGDDAQTEQGYALGAKDYIQKPFLAAELKRSIQNQLHLARVSGC